MSGELGQTGTSGSCRRATAGLPAVWWLSLAVLCLNDHVLKGSGALPAAVTGKLSDLAGVVVAPLLMCVCLSARSARRRIAAFVLALSPFVITNVSAAAAAAWSRLLTGLGIPSRVFCDPTDLFALVLVPWVWLLARSVPGCDPVIIRRIAVATALVACMATSVEGPTELSLQPPFIINWTRLPVTVEVMQQLDPDCELVDAGPPGVGPAREITLRPAQIVALSPISTDAGPMDRGCGALSVSLESGDELTVQWDADVGMGIDEGLTRLYAPDGQERWQVSGSDAWAFDRAVTIIGPAKAPGLLAGQELQTP